jgi:hypothetical protein
MAERTLQQPLNDEDLTDLKEALKVNTQLIEAWNKAKRAGIEPGSRLEDLNAQRTKIQSLINTYFPGR